jgi:hypothetical protein
MINTGTTPKSIAGKKPSKKPAKATKKPTDDMSAKKASKKDIDKAVKGGKARYAK